ncbi:substrate-binding domain-containing protein [Acuticoccus sediminis]|uniref:substrate-binding domain-containing protein n=1 Tax=Acuticoccus sediminis TaxID=2184697 RepID=UPI0038516FA0
MPVKFTSIAALAAAGALVATGAAAQSRDTIQIAGSSTVLPFASVVAEEFGNAYPEFNTPVVGSGGSSGGLRQFCQGVGENTIDIANASRRIRQKEVDACNEAGVDSIVEIKIGYDGIVFASDISTGHFQLTPAQLYQALAAEVPVDGKLAANPYTNWNQIDSALPDQEITLVIPGTNHGTREVFEEKVVLPGCESFEAIEALGDAAEEKCLALRQDGRVIEVAGDYTETLGRLDAQPNAVGVFGLSFYDQNRDRLQVATIDGVEPSMETIATGEYPVSRPLYFYIKGQHMDAIPGLADYALFFVSEDISGDGSPLSDMGLIPLSADERDAQIDKIENKTNVEL